VRSAAVLQLLHKHSRMDAGLVLLKVRHSALIFMCVPNQFISFFSLIDNSFRYYKVVTELNVIFENKMYILTYLENENIINK
jgi:hypothetical protein